MGRRHPLPSPLAEPRDALSSYLDSLLTEVSAGELDGTPPTVNELDAGAGKSAAMPLQRERDNPAGRPFAEPVRTRPLLLGPPVPPLLVLDSPGPDIAQEVAPAEQPVVAGIQPASVKKPPADTAPAGDDTPATEAGKVVLLGAAPSWARHDFQCLTFMVAGVTLAAPLEKLHGIVEWHGELTGLPGYADWFMGLLPNRGQNVRVIDTAQIIMPGGSQTDARPAPERVKYVVLIDQGRWGLAVDAIAQVVMLEPGGVRWRGEHGRRPWLAGTAVEQMCAVLDIDNLSQQLAQGLKLDE